MRLFIAEKPSMAREISKCLVGTPQRRNGYIVHGDDVVTWVVGHVLHQAEPGEYDERYMRWNAADLPIVPKQWKLMVTDNVKDQFETVKSLIAKADTIVNAGDPDREGQLLIDEVLLYVGNQKPVQRILLNALDEKSVKAALQDLRNNEDFYNLYQSALARQRADWLMGMNLSRAYTLDQRRKGNKVTLPIGRVKTPTLALVVRRERELAAFKPVDYFTIKILYQHENGDFWATWQPRDEQKGLDAEGRLVNKNIGQALIERLQQSPQGQIVKVTKQKKKESPRLPLSLSALQVLAGKAYGYEPQQVLDTAQKLYEKKLTSYPRSDCEYLPENQWSDRVAILNNLTLCGEGDVQLWAQAADDSIRSRAWNDKKITAHHAIIPTTVPAKMETLSVIEQHIYRLISQAYIAQFYKDHQYEQTKIEVEQIEEHFVANGRVVIENGWKALYQRKKGQAEVDLTDMTGAEVCKADQVEESDGLPAVKKGDAVHYIDGKMDAKQTKPPSRFTAATLLQAMKEIHKFVKNEDLKKQLKAVSGIGTEATRATIIEELITRGFMKPSGKKRVLSPTKNGELLIDALPEALTYPDETAMWEERLAAMSEGQDSLQSFLDDQVAFLQRLIDALQFNVVPKEVLEIAPQGKSCPKCDGGALVPRQGKFGAFLGCNHFPQCRYTEPLPGSKIQTVSDTTQDIAVAEEDKQYSCPRCKRGYLVKVPNRNDWVCNRRSTCRTSCSDVNGVPSIYKR